MSNPVLLCICLQLHNQRLKNINYPKELICMLLIVLLQPAKWKWPLFYFFFFFKITDYLCMSRRQMEDLRIFFLFVKAFNKFLRFVTTLCISKKKTKITLKNSICTFLNYHSADVSCYSSMTSEAAMFNS